MLLVIMKCLHAHKNGEEVDTKSITEEIATWTGQLLEKALTEYPPNLIDLVIKLDVVTQGLHANKYDNLTDQFPDVELYIRTIMNERGHKIALTRIGFDMDDFMENGAHDSVVSGVCNFCFNEKSVEPDAEFDCPDCGIGTIKSATHIILGF